MKALSPRDSEASRLAQKLLLRACETDGSQSPESRVAHILGHAAAAEKLLRDWETELLADAQSRKVVLRTKIRASRTGSALTDEQRKKLGL